MPDVKFTSLSRIVGSHTELASCYPSGALNLEMAPGKDDI